MENMITKELFNFIFKKNDLGKNTLDYIRKKKIAYIVIIKNMYRIKGLNKQNKICVFYEKDYNRAITKANKTLGVIEKI